MSAVGATGGAFLTRHRKAAGSAIIAAVMCKFGCGAAMAQEWAAGAVTTLDAEYVKNPYFDEGKGPSTAAGRLDVRPFASYVDDRTNLRLETFATLTQYAKTLGLEDNYGANLRLRRRVSSRLDVNAMVRGEYVEARLGSLTNPVAIGDSGGAGPVLPPVDPSIPDVTLLGSRARAKTGEATVGFGLQIDDRNRLEADVNLAGEWFKNPRYDDYQSYGGEVRYSRVIDSRLSLGVIGGGTFTDYDGNSLKRGRSTYAMASTDYQFNSRWKASISGGMSFSKVDGRAGQLTSTFNSFTVRANVCRVTTMANMCLSYRRVPQPTALGGVRTSDNVRWDYNLRLNERNRIMSNLSYLKTSQGKGPVLGFTKIEFFGGSIRYEHSFNPRFLAFAATNIGKLRQSGFQRDPSILVSAGVTIRLGANR